MIARDEKVSQIRLTAVQYVILAIFMILAYGLWRLQVVQSDMYASLAEKNRVRNVPILAPRGKILDREGRTIVENYPSFTALLLRDSSRDLNADAPLIAGLGDNGMGLSIAKALVEGHGGRIWVITDPGTGSTFYVLLPLEGKYAKSNGARAAAR